MKLRRFIASWLLLIPFVCMGQEADSLTLAQQDSLAITESDDFVKASILVATPSNVLYSCAGHASIRMQCPYYDLDVVYTYESESVKSRVLTFLMGGLKMGMISVPTERVLSDYGSVGRGITEYPLNIPLDKRKNLWQYLDEKVAEGMTHSMGSIEKGCAFSTLRAIQTAILPDTLSFGKWDEKFFKKTRRTLLGDRISGFPWNRFVIFSFASTEVDQPCSVINKLLIPADLMDVLSQTKLNGQPLLGPAQIKVQQTVVCKENIPLTPLMVAYFLLALAVVSCFSIQQPISYIFLALQSAGGLLMVGVLLFSTLPCTGFSWLLIPFNPLPLLLWRWRRWWLLPFGLACCVWSIVMLAHKENPLVDPAHIVLVFSLAVNYVGQWYQIRKIYLNKQIINL